MAPAAFGARPEALELAVETLPGVGPTPKKRLAKLGLRTVGDLLDHRPRRYERPVPERRIADLFGDEEAVIEGRVRRASGRRRGRLQLLTAHVADGTGEIRATWFNQPWLEQKLEPGTHVRLRGAPEPARLRRALVRPRRRTATADFAPVYPASEELSRKKLRELVDAALPHATDGADPLPAALRAGEGYRSGATRSRRSTRRASLERGRGGRRRLAFDELLVLQLGARAAVGASGRSWSRRRSRGPASWSRATAPCCRSR